MSFIHYLQGRQVKKFARTLSVYSGEVNSPKRSGKERKTARTRTVGTALSGHRTSFGVTNSPDIFILTFYLKSGSFA
jgi:hypothetical protein